MKALLAAFLILVHILTTVRQDDAVKKELAKLDGAWQVTGHQTDGAAASEDHWRKVQFIFKGNELTFQGDDILSKKVAKMTLIVDPSTTPRIIDLKVVEGEVKGTALEGIYEIKDDTLKICFRNDEAKNRPAEFTTKAGSNLVLFTLKRDKQK